MAPAPVWEAEGVRVVDEKSTWNGSQELIHLSTLVCLLDYILTTPLHLHPLLAFSVSAVSLTPHVDILTSSYQARHSVKPKAVVSAERLPDC